MSDPRNRIHLHITADISADISADIPTDISGDIFAHAAAYVYLVTRYTYAATCADSGVTSKGAHYMIGDGRKSRTFDS